MTLVLGGTFPVSAVNIGLAASPAVLAADVAVLTEDIAKLTGSLSTKAAITVNFPPSAGYGAVFAAALTPSSLLTAFAPANWLSLNADANASLLLDLAFADIQIAIVEPLVEEFTIGLNSPGLYGWTYAGSAAGFGTTLQAEIAGGFPGGVLPSDQVEALVIATNSFTSWGSFSNGFQTGDSSSEDLGVQTTEQRLKFLGSLNGAFWNAGLQALLDGFDLLLEGLRGQKSAIEAQIDLSIGLNLPNPIPIIDFGLEIDLVAALDDFVNVQTDLVGEISLIQADIDATLETAGDIALDLSAGGLTFWSYSGAASGLGAELADELNTGLPGTGEGPSGAVYGVVLASASPTNWDDFGRVFKT